MILNVRTASKPNRKNRRKRQYRSHRENKIDKRKNVRSAKPKT